MARVNYATVVSAFLLHKIAAAFASGADEAGNTYSVDVISAGSQSVVLSQDASTQAAIGIDYEHHEIHEGNHYFVAGADTGIASAATVEFTVLTPDTTTWSHMTFHVEGVTDGVTMDIREGVTASGGTAATPVNSNRNSANTSGMTLAKDPTVSASGSSIYTQTSGANRNTGIVKREDEIVLKQNTKYLFRMTSLGNANTLSYEGSWYEHANAG